MSVLHSIGETQHRLLTAEAELGALRVVTASEDARAAIVRALNEITEARATLAAVQLVLRGHGLGALLEHHIDMVREIRQAANLARMRPGEGLHRIADHHAERARLLNTIIGSAPELVPAPTATEGGRE